jgi:hypothetical protein
MLGISRPRGLVAIAALVALAFGCSAEPDPRASSAQPLPPPGEAKSPAAVPTTSCVGSTNPVDIAVCPRLVAEGCARAPVDPAELCRRLFVDLAGRAPTAAESDATCKGRNPREIAKALLATDDWLRRAKELWAERLAYDPAQVDGKWLADADTIVADYARGVFGWDEFARRVGGHPVLGIGARLPRSDVIEDDTRFVPQSAERATRLFLGRAPVGEEARELASLYRFWRKDIVVLNGDYGRAEAVLDPTACPCEAHVFGSTTRVDLPIAKPMRIDDVPAMHRVALGEELRKVGDVFTRQEAFWTQGADIPLAMFLGWWRSTTNLDATTLPELEVALAKELRTRGSFRELVLDIVTSTLYVRSNRTMDGTPEDAPVWCVGPQRLLHPEAYVSTLGSMLSVNVGRCDHRTYEAMGSYYSNNTEGAFFPYRLREDVLSDRALGTDEYHREASLAMGGCNAGAPRTEEPTLTWVFGAAAAAAKVCAVSEAVVPPGVARETRASADVANRVLDHVTALLLRRAPTADERAAALSDPDCAGDRCDARTFATMACSAVARSTPFVTY